MSDAMTFDEWFEQNFMFDDAGNILFDDAGNPLLD